MLLKKLFREPLVHFLLLGSVLFAAHGALVPTSEPGKIVVSQVRIGHLTEGFARTWLRAPTAEELEGLIRDYIREEVYCREAMAMGLDRDDTIIRRRLQQKLEFLSENVNPISPRRRKRSCVPFCRTIQINFTPRGASAFTRSI